MGYQVMTVTLVRGNRSSTAPAAHVFSKSDITEYLTDLGNGVQSERYMLMSVELSAEFEKHRAATRSKTVGSIDGLLTSLFSHNGPRALLNFGKLAIEGPRKRLSSDPFNWIEEACKIMLRRGIRGGVPRKFDCGRIGILL
jgi:hypothetical protein